MKILQYIILTAALMLSGKAYPQLNAMGSTYFQNQYLANPAMAGVQKGWQIGAAYKVQWTAIDGSPSMQAFSLTKGIANTRLGFGLSLYNESAGVIHRTSIKATYAYHLPLNNNAAFIDFGLSAGLMNEWIDFLKITGDTDDQSLQQFNARKLYLDGDFGIALRNGPLIIQAGIPNLKSFLNRDLRKNSADRSSYMGAVSYRFTGQGGAISSVEPKLIYRGIHNYKNIVDLGAQMQFWEDKLTVHSMYHSTNSMTVGIGTLYQNQLHILCFYTTGTSDLGTYSNGEFEIALRFQFR
ncbi:type IX secretion system PorP/SprF family membrane protein [Chryseobacterium sp. 52]|uniref:PorP/SprF family type IX secretion system membrane protein n=1 Tax=Chryseobacterium sp. 52 TaxID=2035213 RepID=UPI000C1900BF|nr:type IX secretion system membrane protein PorP/SprF [Chryseobacterium sp. 52]PIF45300.1 type IX secretion system PorP/SprF family membrane protein [Chryseobacterium sp. 52]